MKTRWMLLAATAALILPAVGKAQVRNFSRRQQVALNAYIQQQQAQLQARQQAQARQLQQQINIQQQQLFQERLRQQRIAETIEDLADGQLDGPRFRRIRGNQSFGDLHFQSPFFQRLGPYYDFRFVQTRNRILMDSTSSLGVGF